VRWWWWINGAATLAVLLPSLVVLWRRLVPSPYELTSSGSPSRRAMPYRSWSLGTGLAAGGAVLIVALGATTVSRGNQNLIGQCGLIQALPIGYFVSLVLLSASFLWQLLGRRSRMRPFVLGVHLVGLVVLLHGAPALLEREPRFPTAWLHVGFVGQLLQNHVAAGAVDARFNWPGFFGAAAAVTGAGGLDSALPLLRWAPVAMVLAYLLPLYVIGRQLTGSLPATWLGLWLFVLFNWVGQDYFAPQSLCFVLYLTAVAVLVCFFRQPSPQSSRDPRTSWPSRLLVGIERFPFDGLADIVVGRRTRFGLVCILITIYSAVVMSHQLTPIMLTLSAGALVLVGRCRLTMLPIIGGVLTLLWISVGTTDYWVGHLATIFGGIGDVQAVVSNSVGERVGGSPGHLAVVKVRLAFTASVWALMGVSAMVLWLRKRPPLTLFALGITPFLTLVQNYGSEGVLRIFLFSSPFAALLLAQLATSLMDLKSVRMLTAVAAVLLLPVFLLTRYGNESFEQVRSSEVSAMRLLYARAPQGSVFVSPASQVPWRFEEAVEQRYSRPSQAEDFMAADPAAVRDPVETRPKGSGHIYLIVTRSQIDYGYEALGFPPGWFAKLRPMLNPSNGYHLQFRNKDAWIYEFEAPR